MNESENIFDLSGRVALITGAGGVQGRMHARTLAEFGATVILADIDAEAAARVCAEIADVGCDAWSEVVDISQSESVEALARRISERVDHVDILFNNAGIVTPGRMTHDVLPDEWARVLTVNLTGAFLMIRSFIPLLRQSNGASIINNGSMLGLVGLHPGFAMVNAPYAAAKAGLFGLTRQVAAEYASENIRCNAIAPGWHGGSGVQRSLGLGDEKLERFEQVVVAGTPMRRRGRMDELRGLVVWLASNASSYVTGQVITQDGGWTIA
ncbi:hypothetical protein A6V36_27300 [Paraburkholderia ginsengiterrae]|uniref:Short-chain dehydrogenase n=1 Tax=Paraburkholderia ginsengiterrae TaxID=1462993 RepID=A0A1A9NC16_9BURK|nr:SDR family NAD(P)-dependent oxidoreductase [Paraburkholderia ginsengiterrae]OAJ59359.1 hypothetical protein A6V36_27300 [Paraburkholderia ginsengiterrae]OAJ63272.1 hypothetical protein A6V37_20445 [Paraburkholderia ginsengiterrae]